MAVALTLTLLPALTSAHAFNPLLLELRESDAGIVDVLWKVPAGSEGGELVVPTDVSAIRPSLPSHCHPTGTPSARLGTGALTTTWQVDCAPDGLAGAELAITGLEGSPRDVLVRFVRFDGSEQTALLGPGHARLRLAEPDATEASGTAALATLGFYVQLGAEHIGMGVDHLLFVLGLVLLVSNRRALVFTITAFTLAHSLTLALTTLDVVHLPQAPVEAAIALSIALLAAELARPPGAAPTWARRAPWAVAGSFGLLHGFGFATALAEVGLPPGQVPLALLGFNVGVELGQLAFVAVLVAVLAGLRQWAPTPRQQRLATLVTAYVIGALAMAWALERVAGFTEVFG